MNNMCCANTAAVIKRMRYDLGLTQAELAERIGVHTSTVKQWETRRCKPSPEHYKIIRHFFGSRIANGDDIIRRAWEQDEKIRQLTHRKAGDIVITPNDID